MKYEQPPLMSRAELEQAFRGGSGERVRDALISASYSEDASWLLDWCLTLVNDERSIVRHGVAVVLGHIAISDRRVNLMRCLETVEKLTDDVDETARTAARSSLDDVLHAIRLQGTS